MLATVARLSIDHTESLFLSVSISQVDVNTATLHHILAPDPVLLNDNCSTEPKHTEKITAAAFDPMAAAAADAMAEFAAEFAYSTGSIWCRDKNIIWIWMSQLFCYGWFLLLMVKWNHDGNPDSSLPKWGFAH